MPQLGKFHMAAKAGAAASKGSGGKGGEGKGTCGKGKRTRAATGSVRDCCPGDFVYVPGTCYMYVTS